MPLLGLDADAHPFLLVEVEAFAFVGPDPGLFCGVAGRALLVHDEFGVYCVGHSQSYVVGALCGIGMLRGVWGKKKSGGDLQIAIREHKMGRYQDLIEELHRDWYHVSTLCALHMV